MSELIEGAVTALNDRLSGSFDAVAKFVVDGAGSIVIDEAGARAGDDEADVTLTADEDTFRAILDGSMSPASAVMSGKLDVAGDMAAAMRLGGLLG